MVADELIIITGMSGAGKASAAKVFEDLEYLVVDNLPPPLLTSLITESRSMSPDATIKTAVVVDVRSRELFASWRSHLEEVRALIPTRVLFIDASDGVLVQRFKETRRRHPVPVDISGVLGSIQRERDILESVKSEADRVVDTSTLDLAQLRTLIASEFGPDSHGGIGLTLIVQSFGFKHGLPLDADLVFDVRFLINPHYVDSLRHSDGRDAEVENYVLKDEAAIPFLDKLFDLMSFTVPRYVVEGKAYLCVAVGCTGGRHRSVVVAERLNKFLAESGYRTIIQHRDVGKQ